MALDYAQEDAPPAPAMPQGAILTNKETAQFAGVRYQSVMAAIKRGALHPVHIPWMRRAGIFRREAEAYRDKRAYIPTTEELAWLIREGYPREAFRTYEEARQSSAHIGASALVSPADVLAYVQGLSASLSAGASGVGGEVAERAMRPFAEIMREGVQVDIPALTGAAGEMAERAMRPFAQTIRESIAPITASMAEAARIAQGLPTTDVEKQINALRVESAYMFNRGLGTIQPMVERLQATGHLTPEDTAPFLAFMREATESLKDSPFYELARQASAMIPGLLDTSKVVDDATPAAPPSASPSSEPGAPGARE